MNGLERWLLATFAAAAAVSAVAFFAQGFFSGIMVILIFTGVGIPLAFIVGAMPTVLLYMVASLPVYLLLRRRSRPAALLLSLSVSLAAGMVVANRANEQLADRMARLAEGDRPGAITLPPGKTVAYLYDYFDGFDWYRGCADHCQRLLFSGVANAVILGDTSALQSPTRLDRYWLAKANGDCPDVWTPDVYASDDDVGKNTPYPRRRLTVRLSQLEQQGFCLFHSQAELRDADYILAHWFHPESGAEQRRFDPAMGRINRWSATAIYQRQPEGFRIIRRQLAAQSWRVARPLAIVPPFSHNVYTPGHWMRGDLVEVGREPPFGLSTFLTNDLRVPGLQAKTYMPAK